MVFVQLIPYTICLPDCHLCKNEYEKKDRNTYDHMNFKVPLPKSTGNLNLFQVLGLTGSCMVEAQMTVADFSSYQVLKNQIFSCGFLLYCIMHFFVG